MPTASRTMTPRALINVGVFSAIYFVVTYASGMLGFFSPAMMFVGWLVGLLLNGTVVMLFLSRVRVFGALALFGAIVGVIMVLTGHVWYTAVGAALLGLVGDLIAVSGSYRSQPRNVAAYAVSQLWLTVPLLPIIYQSDAYFAGITSSMGAEYSDAMRVLFTPWVILAWGVVIVVVSLFSGWIGSRLLHGNFERAGIA